jgi:phosphoenolpyruvate---glycerone phosphotransferase subunit DhaM
VVGIVLVSHSSELAQGLASLASQMAGPDVSIQAAGGSPDGGLGTDEDRVKEAIKHADQGDGVVVLGDLGSAILTVRHVLERASNGHVRLVDAPIVEGAVAAAVTASASRPIDEVAGAAEEARGAKKL